MTHPSTPIPVAIYCRSAHASADIAEQRQRCIASLGSDAGRWLVLPERYDDVGCPGTTLERPALQGLLDDLPTGRIGAVAVASLDRLARSLADLHTALAACQRAEVMVLIATAGTVCAVPLGRTRCGLLLLHGRRS